MAEGAQMTPAVLKSARIRLPHSASGHPGSGRSVGGPVAERHDTGEVTIFRAGMRKRGRPITPDEMRAIEEGAVS